MPIPKPNKNEEEKEFISRCATKMADLHPEMDNKQRLAICYQSFGDSKKKSNIQEKINFKNITEQEIFWVEKD